MNLKSQTFTSDEFHTTTTATFRNISSGNFQVYGTLEQMCMHPKAVLPREQRDAGQTQ
jgi:hypothetical protein